MTGFLNNPQYYYLDKFEFENGKVLEDVKVEYLTGGTPKYDDEGRITNAIVYCHGSGGNHTSIKKLNDLTSPGDPFDIESYFFISITSLGAPNSCSPSTTELFYNFPKYTIGDLVNFQKQFIEEKFNIVHLKGVMGNSMGGYLALTWATMYPDYMDFVITLVSSYKTAGHNYILARLCNEVITSDPNYEKKGYSRSLSRTLKLATQLCYGYGLSLEQFRNMSKYELDVGFDDFGDEGLFKDIYDIKYENDAILNYDIEDKLDNIEAKVLIVGINQDLYFPPQLDAVPMGDLIENSKVVCYDSVLGHLGTNELIKIKDELQEFMDEF